MKKLIPFLIMCFIMVSFIAEAQEFGDVNGDASIDIVDGLLVAQHYVGLSPVNFRADWADVDDNSFCDIVDALLIAQFYVGLIPWFPKRTPTPAPTPVITDPPALPREIQAFINQLEIEFRDSFGIYLIDVEQSMLEIYPPRFNVSVYLNPDLDIAYRMGMLAASSFSIWAEEETGAVNVELRGLTAEYLGIEPQPEGQLLIEGLMILIREKEVTPAVLGMMGKILLHNYYSDGTIYFEYNGVYYKIYRDYTGTVQLEADYPPIVKNFEKKLQREVGNTYLVEIYDIYFFVPPEFPTWGVKVVSIIDSFRPGELSIMDFHIQDQRGTIVVNTASLSVNYERVDPQPPAQLLYEGILLWIPQYPTFAPVDTYPVSILARITINRVDPAPVIYFTDPMGAKWMIYMEGEKVVLEPIK